MSEQDGQATLHLDGDRLAGREYEVRLSYTVEFVTTVVAGPEEAQAVERASEIAYPGGSVDPTDWDRVHEDVDEVRKVWMDDPDAPKAATWLDEPHVPSERTYWNDQRHFGGEDSGE
jgi:hypothetical protein